jgi:hypothetical protein
MWPKLSNINKDIHDKITNRNNLEASKLNCWVRLFSGVGDGLIMVSNPDTKLFAAAGEGGIYGFAGNATEGGYSGIVGNDWEGNPINPEAGRSLRPSPIVKSLEFSEGEDQISRSGKISLTVFSLEQMELIQEYFMEPGYNLFIEWGWNTPDGASGLIDTNIPNLIPSLASRGNLIQSSIRNKALGTNGDYDNMLGFIVGGSVGNDGENFSVEIELRGTPELPSYLQQQNVIFATTGEGGKIKEVQGAGGYGPGELTTTKVKNSGTAAESDPDALGRRFANMFNTLPSHRQTDDVRALKKGYSITDLINCDSLITNNIDTWIKDTTFWGGDKKLEVGSIEIERQKLFSKHKYIRFEKALDIILASGLDSYNVGGGDLNCTIDISSTKIGAFPLIFSTKPEALLISGVLPDFKKYFLQKEQPKYKQVIKPNVDNSIKYSANMLSSGVSFVQWGRTTTGHTEKGGYWGYLKNLYINLDMMVDKISVQNKNIKDVLYDILNEMSSAVNSFWDFQIVEGQDKDKNIVLTVIDRNWVGEKSGTPKEFHHNGDKSRFLNSSLSIDIPGEMASQIISTRLGASVKKDGASVETGSKRFFAKERDRFMTGLSVRSTSTQKDPPDLNTNEGKRDRLEEIEAEQKDINSKAAFKKKISGGYIYYAADPNDPTKLGAQVYSVRKTAQYDDDGKRTGTKDVAYASTEKGKELEKEKKEIEGKIKTQNESNVTSSVDKIDIVPNPTVLNDMKAVIKSEILTEGATNKEVDPAAAFDKNFKIYTFRDTNLFDIIKNNAFLGKSTGRLSHPLPIKYSFTILGSSGIRRGDMFNIVGIPEKYKKYGLFQVNSVEHSIEGMKWETTIEGLYRQIQ